ncbi:PREDICTED: 39S ribosomal protein L2, mitochondrial [Charadrius vociferus]|uniref:39S ribosomal protein L2, mitochondrial n=1 Tax=Charadrius vociferus TaxID=50402 RepID=UPI0005216DF3|nr:PREDICTED: 39S ribosomal protein L2, mitochondrial [Charadrius vociferus]
MARTQLGTASALEPLCQEARPLRILGTSKPEKPLHPLLSITTEKSCAHPANRRLGTLPVSQSPDGNPPPPRTRQARYLAACSGLSDVGTPGGPGPRRSAPSYTRSCAKRFYIPFGIALIFVPTADAIPAPKAKQVELQRTLQLCYRYCCAHKNGQIQDKIAGSPTVSALRMSANEGDAYPLGALPVGTLICNLESHPGKGAQYIRAAGTCGVLLRKVNGTAIVQLPSKRQMQVLETCVATVGRVSNVDHNKRVIGKAGRNRWLGKRPHTGLWHRKGGWAGRKIKPIPPMKSYVNLPRVTAQE